jgi:hypothetical protein
VEEVNGKSERRRENVRTITVLVEQPTPEGERPGIRLGIGVAGVEEMEFLPPQEISIRLEAGGRYEADLSAVGGWHGKFSFVPWEPMVCEIAEERGRKILRCWSGGGGKASGLVGLKSQEARKRLGRKW